MIARLRQVLDRVRRASERGSPRSAPTATSSEPDFMTRLTMREVAAMRRLVPELSALAVPITAENAAELKAACCQMFPALRDEAREAAWRSGLVRLLNHTQAPDSRRRIERAIAESDLRCGIFFSVWVRAFPDLWYGARERLARHESGYGAAVFSQPWSSYSRGNALIHYFSHHVERLRGARVLHVAPEPEAQAWFGAKSGELGIRYETLNVGGDIDRMEDLTALSLGDDTYDWVLCHRVLEHIFDEAAALSEMRRVLKPGGVANLSVPESFDMDATIEWLVPDLSHHEHYRQYGSDFPARLAAAGLRAEVVKWLLQRPREELEAAKTYPMLMYNATKTGPA